MPTREDPRLTLRLDSALDGRLDGAARGAAVKKGTLARRAIELGLDAAIVEAREEAAGRADGERIAEGIRRAHASPAARRERRAGLEPVRLDEVVAGRLGGSMVAARRAINGGLVTVDGRVARDVARLVSAGMRVGVEG